MKRFLPALAVFLCLCALCPGANAWWWSRHHNSPGPAGVGANSKPVKVKKEKHHQERVEHLYNSPKSWGWFHKSPGPMGAGS
jgi:hypothetical protein